MFEVFGSLVFERDVQRPLDELGTRHLHLRRVQACADTIQIHFDGFQGPSAWEAGLQIINGSGAPLQADPRLLGEITCVRIIRYL